jgi:uncharacterized delta-60 repeat protein
MKKIILLLLIFGIHDYLVGQAGSLDTDFGDNGIVNRVVVANSQQEIQAVAELPDGSIVTVGGIEVAQVNSLMSRHGADGSVLWDVEFDASKQNLPDFTEALLVMNNFIYTISFFDDQSQGFQTVSGSLTRWNFDGTVDMSFGDEGSVRIPGFSTFGLSFFDIQNDEQNRIYLIGRTLSITPNDESALVIRMDADGNIDEDFGNSGTFTKQWNGTRTGIIRGKIIADELYLVGWYNNLARTDLNAMLAKVTAQGNIDNNFGTDGRITFTQTNEAEFWSLDQHGPSHLLVTGSFGDSEEDIIVRRYSLTGVIDPNFGVNGTTILDFGGDEDVRALIVDVDDGIYIGGKVNDPEDFGLVRLTSNGSLDQDFANNGLAVFDIDGDDDCSEMALLSDGNLVLVGEANNDNSMAILKVIGINGCSTVMQDITLNACDSVMIGDETIYNSGEYQFVFNNSNGCDSIVNLSLTINESVAVEINLSDCDSVFYNGDWIYQSGIFTDTLVASNGCDSIITLDVEVLSITADIEMANGTLGTNIIATSYQWIDCSTNLPIDNATTNTFSPITSGEYALALSDGMCVDTSDCIAVISTSTEKFEQLGLKLFPNPVNNQLNFQNPEYHQFKNIKIVNSQSQVLKSITTDLSSSSIDVSDLAIGYYFFVVETFDGKIGHFAFVKS